MKYVVVGYVVCLGVLFAYSVGLILRRRRLVRQLAATTTGAGFDGAGVTGPQGAVPDAALGAVPGAALGAVPNAVPGAVPAGDPDGVSADGVSTNGVSADGGSGAPGGHR